MKGAKREWIPFNKPSVTGRELEFMRQAVDQAQLSGNGPFTQKCHSWIEERLGCRKALLTHSCTAALEMAALLCNVGVGDEVVLPSFTFVSTANAFVLRGATPVFVDIRADNLNLDERLLEEALTPSTKVIVPVHYAGVGCAMEEILEVSRSRGTLVVEDAAQAFLSTYQDRPLGTIGDIGCLSFHETKNVLSGEGGALLLNREDLIERAEMIWEKGTDRSRFDRGQVDKYTWVEMGSSYLPGELIAAFLYAQLENVAEILRTRQRLCARYRDRLQSLVDKELVQIPDVEAQGYNGHLFYLIARSLQERNSLIQHLLSQEIAAVFHYIPLHSSPLGSRVGRTVGEMRVTNRVSLRLLRLPVFFSMTATQVDRVTDAVCGFYSARS